MTSQDGAAGGGGVAAASGGGKRSQGGGGIDGDKAQKKLLEDEVAKLVKSQTREERRELRTGMRDLQGTMHEKQKDLADPEKDELDRMIDKQDKYLGRVGHAREAVLDAENYQHLSTIPLKHLEALANSTRRYDWHAVIDSLKEKPGLAEGGGRAGKKNFNWINLGASVSACFRNVPEIDFMLGPLEKPQAARKERVKRKRAEEERGPEVQPDQVTEEERQRAKEKEDIGATRVKELISLVAEKLHQGGTDNKRLSQSQNQVDLVSFCFNPKSFTQTVENIFDLSFLTKESAARLQVQEDEAGNKVPVIRAGVARNSKSEHVPKTTQAILSLNMREWQQLCDAYGNEECTVKHRDGYKKDPYLAKMMASAAKGGGGGGGGGATAGGGGRARGRRSEAEEEEDE